jgi:hypothetical protein
MLKNRRLAILGMALPVVLIGVLTLEPKVFAVLFFIFLNYSVQQVFLALLIISIFLVTLNTLAILL